ncbi:epidermal growth factor receptor kinase substrate 8-like protein 3b [Aulostomus maculatus]
MSRPSGKSIYMQRKEYSEVLNRTPDNFYFRVEHLLTCELDGQDARSVDDCVAKLKRLDVKGRVWAQEMILEVQGRSLRLCEIETKEELELLPLSCIQQTRAVLDSCAYNSLLTVSLKDRSRRFPQVFLFQCEETGAATIKSDLDKIIQKGGETVEPRRDRPEPRPEPRQEPRPEPRPEVRSDIRGNLESIIGRHALASLRQAGPRVEQPDRTPPPPDILAPQWGNREREMLPSLPRFHAPPDEAPHYPDEFQSYPDVPASPEQTDMDRNTDILNHVIADMETFMNKLSAAANGPPPEEGKKSKKKNVLKKKKSKKNASPAATLPPPEEYVSCLQKIKYGFNLLGQLDGALTSPSAPDYVHIFFSFVGMMVPHYPADVPSTVLSPLLSDATVQLLSGVVSSEEEEFWRSLGDAWNISRSRWTYEDVPPYIPEFYDGWQPPSRSHVSSTLVPYQNGPMSRSNSQRFQAGRPNTQMNGSQDYAPRGMLQSEPVSRPPPRPSELPLYMRVIYDFMARNNRELSVMKGEVVEVVQKSKQWSLVRNSRAEEGNVPQNVLESMEDPPSSQRQTHGSPTLDMTSKPAEVRAWLESKRFSKITVTSLGVLSGKLLLNMTKEEIRTVCPEEGGKVFYQLQAVKSAIALASEPSGRY